MSKTRIGLMGFGRIGKNVFRMLTDHPDLEVAVIADIDDPAGLTYLLKYDSIYGRFPKPVELEGSSLFLDGRRIPFIDAREPGDADWAAQGVDIVVQATGKYRTAADLQKHLDAGAKKVIMASTPALDEDIPLLLRGINDDVLTDSTNIVSLGSNTSNALAPILKILDYSFGIDKAMFTTVHAITNEQRLADVPTSGFGTSRAAGENIIPATDELGGDPHQRDCRSSPGRSRGMALNVPVADGSTVDLVAGSPSRPPPRRSTPPSRAPRPARTPGSSSTSTDPIVSSMSDGHPIR